MNRRLLASSGLGVDLTETYAGDLALGIRLTADGDVLVGPSNDLY